MFVLVPTVFLTLPAVAGYPIMTGDEQLQNYPLRILVGEELRHGHLPFFDPFIWSGAPLLAGANAGAFSPLTLLFAVLPGLAAWVIGEILIFVAASIGCHVFLRLEGCSPLPAALAAGTFAYGGFMTSQAVHIDFLTATAMVPVALVAINRIACGTRARPGRVGGVAGGGGRDDRALGEPRGPRLRDAPARRLRAVGAPPCRPGPPATACRVGDGARRRCGAARGRRAVAADARLRRRVATGAGGLRVLHRRLGLPGQWLLELAPHVFGGGPIGMISYTGDYNLGELDAYMGVLPLVAACVLATRWRSPGAGRWRVWYLVLALGVLLALGGYTPLAHITAGLPGIGRLRLPSRALFDVDLALALIFGFFVDELLRPARASATGEAGLARAAGAGRFPPRREVVAGLVPPALILLVLLACAALGDIYARTIGNGITLGSWTVLRVAPYLLVAAVFAVGAAVIVVFHRSWPLSVRARAVALFTVADLLVFVFNQSSLAPTYAWV